MKKKGYWIIGGVVVVLIGGGILGNQYMNSYLGNNVEIESVTSGTAAGSTEQAGTAVSADAVNGEWTIADTSNIYWSITTSRETVNFVDKSVAGSWTVDLNDPTAMSGQGTVQMAELDSGNAQRDEHLQTADFLDVATYPEAQFEAKSFTSLPTEWTEGEKVPVQMTGTMTVRGIEKEVTFDSEVVYSGGQLLLSGTTTVTFADFGLTNPHSVVLETENDIRVQLELVLTKA
ncbi:YceI family protein [Paenibacillus sp. P96]|uniref:YceI family protein n=1 Tax=Paenibacillus zeirhizosphaerae TaxID=2987519 RepID=A0ABT9FX95_9BACL|nr:YceI family protein [Paenibacillus sp. P96]MDP4099347.1 YceI family protein [Paenibacillus sp. P96]